MNILTINGGSKAATNQGPIPASVDHARVEFPNAVWHEAHTFTLFPHPTFSEDDMHQIPNAIVKVIEAHSQVWKTASSVGSTTGRR